MTISALICLANGSEEIEVVTTADLLVRAGINVIFASAEDDVDDLTITCSRGIKLIANAPLVRVVDHHYDVIILPGGLQGAETLRNSPLVVEKVRRMQSENKLVAAICAAPSMVLEFHNIYPIGNMTGFPALKDKISPKKWVDYRVYFDERVNLITSQGPATAVDFALKIIERLKGKEVAADVAKQLILPPGIYNYQDEWTGEQIK
ncbi:protein deglycase YajL [Proteus myxofaciens]|uniref:DJ-1/YajL/PfpI superfamily protein n=1 Tax=Proteus myxofaciens ATCC 19692 TaxID=1354337 RepID=A0A198FMP2_9GAMM|nr:protein deglycase YajL [Proteus myxofaciens]OAT25729.1 DJ-1/YajL/PfpI superfamily protein [Proteus myxofaciens ATCC 19692]